ncbi:MAG: IS4 family transposase [Clostridia bacterium]|nr:IS4 family transposase [Clostridia bacterium]
MSNSTTVLGNLLSHLERSDFERAVREHSGDRRVRTLSTYNLLKTLVYGQVTSAFSVREIESSLAVNSSKLYHCGLTPVKRSTLCDALEKRDHHIFESTFNSLAAKACLIAGNQGRRFKNPLKIIDASTIDLCLERFDWAKFRTTKGAVKLHLKLDGDMLYPEQATITTGAVHEVNEMDNLCKKRGEIYVMDRGYIDYKRLHDIELANSFFVTRMKSNCDYENVKKLFSAKTGSIRYDGIMRLKSKNGAESYPGLLRKVCYHDDEYDRNYIFITNNFELSAQDVADIYKSRWQVELFFKWIKQNLRIKTFWGTSKNAVFIQIWVALIVSLLLWLHKNIDGIKESAQRIIQSMKTTILTRRTIYDLFIIEDPPDNRLSNQLHFQGFGN